MAQVDVTQVTGALPQDGTMVPYREFLQKMQSSIGISASKTLLAAKKKGAVRHELVSQADGSHILYIGLRSAGKPATSVTLAPELVKQIQSAVAASQSTIRRGGE